VALAPVSASGAADESPVFELQRAASVAGSVLVLPASADGAEEVTGTLTKRLAVAVPRRGD